MSQVDPDKIDYGKVLRLMREARAESRGYADYWEWAIDPRRAERHAAMVVRNFLINSGEGVSGPLSSVLSDPPDVLLATDDGRRIGIEVTELVDSNAVKRARHRKKFKERIEYDWADWTPTRIVTELRRIVELKDRKLAKVARNYDELLLAIVTDEGMINEAIAREAAAQCGPVVSFIGRAFFVLSYQPNSNVEIYPDGCPVLPIPLNQ